VQFHEYIKARKRQIKSEMAVRKLQNGVEETHASSNNDALMIQPPISDFSFDFPVLPMNLELPMADHVRFIRDADGDADGDEQMLDVDDALHIFDDLKSADNITVPSSANSPPQSSVLPAYGAIRSSLPIPAGMIAKKNHKTQQQQHLNHAVQNGANFSGAYGYHPYAYVPPNGYDQMPRILHLAGSLTRELRNTNPQLWTMQQKQLLSQHLSAMFGFWQLYLGSP